MAKCVSVAVRCILLYVQIILCVAVWLRAYIIYVCWWQKCAWSFSDIYDLPFQGIYMRLIIEPWCCLLLMACNRFDRLSRFRLLLSFMIIFFICFILFFWDRVYHCQCSFYSVITVFFWWSRYSMVETIEDALLINTETNNDYDDVALLILSFDG